MCVLLGLFLVNLLGLWDMLRLQDGDSKAKCVAFGATNGNARWFFKGVTTGVLLGLPDEDLEGKTDHQYEAS